MRRLVWLLPAALVAAGAGAYWARLWVEPGSTAQERPAVESSLPPLDASPAPQLPSSRPGLPPLPFADGALRGTTVDGGVRLDADGRPRPELGVRRLFDYFLIRLGEQSPGAIREDLRRHLAASLPPPALARVMAWYDAYLALQQESAALGASEDPQADLARRRALRRARLGPELAQAWFAAEEAALERALAARRESGGAKGTPFSRADPADQAAHDAILIQTALEQRRASPTERARLRESLWGTQAARRLAALDARRERWRRRLQAYERERDRVLADPGLSAKERDQALARLLEAFTPNERLRVQVLVGSGK